MKNLKFLVMIISLMMLMTVQMQAQNVGIGDTLFTPDASAIPRYQIHYWWTPHSTYDYYPARCYL